MLITDPERDYFLSRIASLERTCRRWRGLALAGTPFLALLLVLTTTVAAASLIAFREIEHKCLISSGSFKPSGLDWDTEVACVATETEQNTKVEQTQVSPPSSTPFDVRAAVRDERGFLIHRVVSPWQDAPTEIQVLLPEPLDKSRRYPILYVLPVEPGTQRRYGHGLEEIKKHDIANRFGLICVLPTFARLPWYADHPTDPRIRQEKYFVEDIVPFVEKTYPALAEKRGRLLVGFSKSGWGAFSLLLRHPGVFGRAAAWDAPLGMNDPSRYGMAEILGTQENFEKYRVATLLAKNAVELTKEKRLSLLGYGNFREHQVATHALLTKLKILHEYRDGPSRRHSWDSGWLPEAVEFLAGTLAKQEK